MIEGMRDILTAALVRLIKGLCFVICALVPVRSAADEVILKNGDRITGKIVSKNGGKLIVKTDLLGQITVAWTAVNALDSDQPLTVVTSDENCFYGFLHTVEGRVVVGTAENSVSVPLGQIATIRNADEQAAFERLRNPAIFSLWTGYVDLGFATARGNAHTNTFTSAFMGSRTTRIDKTSLHFNQIYSTATIDKITAATAKALRGGWAYDRNAGGRFFFNVFNDYEYDRFQNLDLRFVLGGGAGVRTLHHERTRLDLQCGADYDMDRFSTPLTRHSAEIYLGNDWTYKLNAVTALRQSFRLFNNRTSVGEYRMNFDLTAATSIRKWLAWQASVTDRYFTNPVPGRLRNDVLLTTGFRVNFAQ
jgi:putative salt-induced outer membrane protein YdiY